MTSVSPDSELVSAYAADGSESAFRSLVLRHVDLVYATALRQVGDVGMAEEISQNVFVTLARKAPRLSGVETLAGWLHRATVLEAKARIRAELRRKHREETAAQLATIQHEGASALDALAPLLDEALLHLREPDRLALVLRFLEDRSLRDVGQTLGIEEDAARKRVSRALEKVTEFFRQRGFAVPAGIGVVGVFANSTKAAPTGLGASATKAGLAAGAATGSLHLIVFNLMALTKTHTVAICALLAAAPLVWQWRAEGKLAQEQNDASLQLAAATKRADELDSRSIRVHDALLHEQTEALSFQTKLNTLKAQQSGHALPVAYRWDDDSPYVRVPKDYLDALSRNFGAAANKRGKLDPRMKELLQMSGPEAEQVQSALDRFLAGYEKELAAGMRPVSPDKSELRNAKPEDVRVFELPDVSASIPALRKALFLELTSALGQDRFVLLRNALEEWMPVDDEYHGLNSDGAVFSFKHRVRFEKPQPGMRFISWGLKASDQHGSMSAQISPDEIPNIYRDKLQDWIDLAQAQQAQP